MSKKENQATPVSFSDAFKEELQAMGKGPQEGEPVNAAAHRSGLSGLAFSGGGIRSATFNLGVLQGLARLGVLSKFDYLSTVSGGGYIGSWLTAWIRREYKAVEEGQTKATIEGSGDDLAGSTARQFNRFSYQTEIYAKHPLGPTLAHTTQNEPSDGKKIPKDPKFGLHNVVDALRGMNKDAEKERGGAFTEPKPIAFLREFSNYLTPRRGWWGNDTWTLGVAYIRNFVLTFSVLLGAFIAGVLVIHSLAVLYRVFLGFNDSTFYGLWHVYLGFVVYLSATAFFCSWDMVTCRPVTSTQESTEGPPFNVTRAAIICALFSIWFGAAGLWQIHSIPIQQLFRFKTLLFIAIPILSVIAGGLTGRSMGQQRQTENIETMPYGIIKRIAALFAGGIGLLLTLCLLAFLMNQLPTKTEWLGSGPWLAVVWGPLTALLGYSVLAAIFVGATRSSMVELEREWFSRMFAAITKWTGLLCVLTAIVLYAPIAIQRLGEESGWPNSALGVLWSIISVAGAMLGRSSGSIPPSSQKRQWIARAVMAAAPVVFVTGLIALTSWGLNRWLPTYLNTKDTQSIYWQVLPNVSGAAFLSCLLLGLGVLLATSVWSHIVGVNTFSLHALYGNRLIRAYLGASNFNRNAHPFVGFDSGDNAVKLAHLNPENSGYKGPFLIVNAAINLVHGDKLAWQQRKAGSFTFTPKRCGYELQSESMNTNGECSTPVGGYVLSEAYGSPRGISLGKAMTISGAAASPNMGYHSSAGLAFLMTIFNVRLGWWLPNTRISRPEVWKRGEPGLGIRYLLYELLGWTDAQKNFVYISDGGHFENLGIYELVRRRTRFILASDATADPEMVFGDLGNAIERCRADFGITINIDVDQLRPNAESERSRWHCAVGTIRYSDVDDNAHDGILVYIKSSLTGDEPQDVSAYGSQNSKFPHQSTADQWFDESQFESYRTLGQHIIDQAMSIPVCVMEEYRNIQDVLQEQKAGRTEFEIQKEMECLFEEMQKAWYPPAEKEEKQPVDLDDMLADIINEIRTDPNLSFMDCQLYPDVERVLRSANIRHRSNPWIPLTYEELRAGFCFCKRLLQFMQQVYQDRELDVTFGMPSRRSWMNLLRRWSHSRMLRYTWSLTAGTYSARFQTFCEHHLDLEVGPLVWGSPLTVQKMPTPFRGIMDWSRKLLKDADCASGIDFYENLVIGKFLQKYYQENSCLSDDAVFRVYPLRINTEDPTAADPSKYAQINVGFSIVGPALEKRSGRNEYIVDEKILYIRIHPTMRRMRFIKQAIDNIPINKESGRILPFPQSPEKYYVEFEATDTMEGGVWRSHINREIYKLKYMSPRQDWLEKLNQELEQYESKDAPSTILKEQRNRIVAEREEEAEKTE